jgi:hypothetical protein
MINPGTGTALRISGTLRLNYFQVIITSQRHHISLRRIQGTSFVKTGGLSTQSLMADGTTTIIAVSTVKWFN